MFETRLHMKSLKSQDARVQVVPWSRAVGVAKSLLQRPPTPSRPRFFVQISETQATKQGKILRLNKMSCVWYALSALKISWMPGGSKKQTKRPHLHMSASCIKAWPAERPPGLTLMLYATLNLDAGA